MIRAAALALALAALAAVGGARAQTDPAATAATVPDWRSLDPQNTLVIDTTKGRVIVEMAPRIAPLAVARIKALTRRGYYDGSIFYRVLKGYMAQTGDKGARTFKSDLPDLKAEFSFQIAFADYAKTGTVADGEVGMLGSLPVKTAGGKSWALFCPGSAAMPHYDNPDSANSQLFFMRTIAPALDGTFTVWGRVIQGQEAVDAIENGEPPAAPDRMTRVRVLADMPAAERPALEVMDARGPAFRALLAKTGEEKGPYFNLCDVQVPVRPAVSKPG